MPHLEDEFANFFQAKSFTSGHITADSPSQPLSFFVPFIVDFNGARFAKYTPGYPLVLALGVLIGQPWVINALAAALGILGVYLLGRDLFDHDTGMLAAALGTISPMFLILSGTLLPHTIQVFPIRNRDNNPLTCDSFNFPTGLFVLSRQNMF